jgi:hypothetical protein
MRKNGRRHGGGNVKKPINEDGPSLNPLGGEHQPASKYAAARHFLGVLGHHRLAGELRRTVTGGVRRPVRPLTREEAIAMMKAWAHVHGEAYTSKLRTRAAVDAELAALQRRLP